MIQHPARTHGRVMALFPNDCARPVRHSLRSHPDDRGPKHLSCAGQGLEDRGHPGAFLGLNIMSDPLYREACFRSPVPLSELPQNFGIVTACNPFGQVITNEANQERTRRLHERLDSLGCQHFPVTGGDREGQHLEPGFGIAGLNRESIIRLGAEFEQDAVFWISDGTLHLVPCGPGETVDLGQHATRWLSPETSLHRWLI